MKKIPLFLIQGFLDSGKTTFINKTIQRDKLFKEGTTLIISCEQGEENYDENTFKKQNVHIAYIEDEKEFSIMRINELCKKYNPNRVMIELNFMWNLDDLSYPDYMDLIQVFTIIDGLTFPVYYQNMKQQFTNAIAFSDVVAFTKLNNDATTLQPFKQALAITNYQCLYCLLNEDCMADKPAFDSMLPYDINSNEIVINEHDFGILYIDSFNNKEAYENKNVEFSAWVAKTPTLKKHEFVIGRKVLNCCAEDIQFFGYLVNDDLNLDIHHDMWVHIKGTFHIVYSEEYKEDELVITPKEITEIEPIKPEILDLR